GRPDGRALDVGAACGRITFELARDHAEAWGLDRAEPLVDAALRVRAAGEARYEIVIEGDLRREQAAPVEAPPNTRFVVGDAAGLPFPARGFDTVTALNLICRAADPARVVSELARVTAGGGTLLISSPYTWIESHTPRPRWLGGFVRQGAPVRAAAEVRRVLGADFELEVEERLPFFIPHHARSGQLGSAHVQRFRRKA
ncbi:MAG: methyltransferase domain-containing protein, partial [Planctomycetota bacterium]